MNKYQEKFEAIHMKYAKLIATERGRIAKAERKINELEQAMANELEATHNYKKNAHTEHCCAVHRRCKYSDSDCPVTTGALPASHPCNCEWM